MRKRLRQRLEGIGKKMRLAQGLEPEKAHDLRIAVKKLRYEAELLEAAFPGPAQAVLEALVPLQELLGDLHDADVRLELLHKNLPQEPQAREGVKALLRTVKAERLALAEKLTAELERWRQEKLLKTLASNLE